MKEKDELGACLELMHTASERWITIRAEGLQWRHQPTLEDAFLRSAGDGTRVLGGPRAGTDPEVVEERWRLWQERPDKTRTEFSVGGESVVAVIHGTRWWSWSPTYGARTNEGRSDSSHGLGPGEPMLDPARLLPALELEVLGRTTALGRAAFVVEARPVSWSEDDLPSPHLHDIGSGADDYRLLVDAERGVLLRAEARLRRRPFRVLELTTVSFDEDLAPETFVLEVPASESFEPVRRPRPVRLEDVPAEVSFTVLVPERQPISGAAVDTDIFPAEPRAGAPEQVHIGYSSLDDGDDRSFWITEAGEPLPSPPEIGWRRAGELEIAEHDAPRRVRVPRGTTHVELSSYSLDIDDLIQLALSLVPLPTGPPRVVEEDGRRDDHR